MFPRIPSDSRLILVPDRRGAFWWYGFRAAEAAGLTGPPPTGPPAAGHGGYRIHVETRNAKNENVNNVKRRKR